MIRVLLVDDQVLFRSGLAALVRTAGGFDVAGEASSCDEALALSTETAPDVILMVMTMPATNGILAIRRLLDAATTTVPRVLVLTTIELSKYTFQALYAGASGLLLRDTPPERLLTAIRTVAGGELVLAPSIIYELIEAYPVLGAPDQAADGGGLNGLTARELDVLRLVASGMSNMEIAGRLAVAEATVKTHLNRTMAKLRLASRAQAVMFAYEAGLVRPGSLPIA